MKSIKNNKKKSKNLQIGKWTMIKNSGHQSPLAVVQSTISKVSYSEDLPADFGC